MIARMLQLIIIVTLVKKERLLFQKLAVAFLWVVCLPA